MTILCIHILLQLSTFDILLFINVTADFKPIQIIDFVLDNLSPP